MFISDGSIVEHEFKGVSDRAISVYTVLLVLQNMRSRLGVDAMVDFLDGYTRTIERLNPDIKEAITSELFERGLHGLYQSVCDHEE